MRTHLDKEEEKLRTHLGIEEDKVRTHESIDEDIVRKDTFCYTVEDYPFTVKVVISINANTFL